MGIFPSADDISRAVGHGMGVSDEDQARWEKKRQENYNKYFKGKVDAVNTASKDAIGLLRMGVTAHMYGHEAEDAARKVERDRVTTTTTTSRQHFASEQPGPTAEDLGGFAYP